MAFSFECFVKGAEYRSKNGGTSDNGNPWLRMKFETPTQDGNSDDLWVSVPKDLIGEVYQLGIKKGELVNLVLRPRCGMAQSGGSYDYVQLVDVPVIVEDDE